jgi:ribosomal protein L11 methyltransferase
MISQSGNRGIAAIATLETDERTARRVGALFAECFPDPGLAVAIVDTGRGRWRLTIHTPESADEKAVRALAEAAAGPGIAGELAFQRAKPKDWVKASLAGLAPVRAGRFVVHGAHDRVRIASNRIGIEIEAALAFGTGHHGTTRGCLLALDSICRAMASPLRILDLGTGSGVLAIAAARALRRRVVATDIDAAAVRVARANARLNGVASLIEFVRADGVGGQGVRARAPFDLIVANILLGPLQRLAAPLMALTAPGARIILSGLLTSQANAAIFAYRPLALERRIELDGWTTLVLKREI